VAPLFVYGSRRDGTTIDRFRGASHPYVPICARGRLIQVTFGARVRWALRKHRSADLCGTVSRPLLAVSCSNFHGVGHVRGCLAVGF